MDFFDWVRSRRFRRIAILAGLALVLWGILGFFVLPPLLRPVVERKISLDLEISTGNQDR